VIILHHYEMSPFSEKVRLMLGYAELPWQSLLSPEMPPRANVDPLTGGYRRIPVAQLGADIFCDSCLISAELALASGREQLALENCTEDVVAYCRQLETDIFWATVLSIPLAVSIKQLWRTIGVWGTLRFLADRAGMGKQAKMKTPSPAEARQRFEQHLEELESRLTTPFLFGDEPSHADFAAYHTLWFKREVAQLLVAVDRPLIDGWYRRMQLFGHGRRKEIVQEDAFAAARDNSPRAIPASQASDPMIGREVEIGPDDYALDSVRGTLVGSSVDRWILARQTDQFGLLHVHFPRKGFEIR
jgi:glutathione S-transferase